MRSVFPIQLEQPAGIYDELDVQKFRADEVAVIAPGDQPISGGGEAPTLLDSTLPLRIEDEAGIERVVDLTLQPTEDGLEPVNPLVDVEIPVQLGEGISLPGSGVEIEIPGAPDRAPSNIEGGGAFYPNVDTDSDVIVVPTPTGVETFTLLRTPEAPRRQTFDLQLPEGAHVEEVAGGGAKVVRGEETLLMVHPPSAIDAEGNAVPVSMEVAESTVVVEAAPSSGVAYPILVDPLWESWYWAQNNSSAGSSDWVATTNNPLLEPRDYGYGGSERGLNIYSYWGTVQPGAQGHWNYHVPRFYTDYADPKVKQRPESYISNAYFSGINWWIEGESVPAPANPFVILGLWAEKKGWWTNVQVRTGAEGGMTNSATPLPNTPQYDDTQTLAAVLAADGDTQSRPRHLWIGQATVELTDNNYPNGTAIGPVKWVNETKAEPIKFKFTDPGLGMHSVIGKTTVGGTTYQASQGQGCAGNVSNPCPRTWEGNFWEWHPAFLPQGENSIEIVGQDPIGRYSDQVPGYEPARAVVKVDHTAPSLAPLSGSITEQGTLGTGKPQYALKYSASDGFGETPTFLSSLGSYGSGSGQFNGPGDVAVSPEGFLWVADTNNNRLVKFSEAGAFLAQYGSSGTGNGQFNRPTGLDFDPSGNLWVADRDNNRIQKFTEGGAFLAKFGTKGSGNGQFNAPMDIAADPSGNVWVVDTANNRLQQLSSGGAFIRSIGSLGTGNGQFNSPRSIDVSSSGNVWVADTANNRVQKLGDKGEFLLQFGAAGAGAGQFNQPVAIHTGLKGNLWVADLGNYRVQRFSEAGGHLGQFGAKGASAGQFNLGLTTGIATNQYGDLWVTDAANNRLVKWFRPKATQSGVVGATVKVDGSVVSSTTKGCSAGNCPLNGEWTLKASQFGGGSHNVEVEVVDDVGLSSSRSVQVELHPDKTAPAITLSGSMTEQGTLGTTRPRYQLDLLATDPAGLDGTLALGSSFGFTGSGNGAYNRPVDGAFDSQGNFWIVDQGNNRLQKVSGTSGSQIAKYGSLGSTKGLLSAPSAVAIDSADNVWVADTANNRIQQFNSKGEFVLAFGKNVNKTKAEQTGPEGPKNVCTAASGHVCQAGVAGAANGQLSAPKGIALTPGGNLMVVDTANNRVQKFSPQGEYLAKVGSLGSGVAQLKEPAGIAVASDGSILVADAANNRVQQWSSTFEFIRSIGASSFAGTAFDRPTAVTFDPAGYLWVLDQNNERVVKFTSTGAYVSKYRYTPASEDQPTSSNSMGMRFDSSGVLWLTDTQKDRIRKLNPAQGSRSGVASTTIKVDGKVVDSFSPGCPEEKCSIERNWTMSRCPTRIPRMPSK